MKLSDILLEAKMGKEAFETSKSSDEIVELYDTDYKIFLVSQRIKNLAENSTEDASAVKLIESISSVFNDIEEREKRVIQPTSSYYRMKLLPLVEGFNSLVKKFEDKKYHTKIDKDKFAKILGTISFGIEHVSEEAGKEVYLKDIPVLLEDKCLAEKSLIEEIIK